MGQEQNEKAPVKIEKETIEEQRTREKQEEEEKKKKEARLRNFQAMALHELTEKKDEKKENLVREFERIEEISIDSLKLETIRIALAATVKAMDEILDVTDRMDKVFKPTEDDIIRLLKEEGPTVKVKDIIDDENKELPQMLAKKHVDNVNKQVPKKERLLKNQPKQPEIEDKFKLTFREYATLCQAVVGKEEMTSEEHKYSKDIANMALKEYGKGDPEPIAKLIANGIRVNSMNFSKFTSFEDAARYAEYTREMISLLEEHPDIAKKTGLTDDELNIARGNMAKGFIFSMGLESSVIIETAASEGMELPEDMKQECLKNIMAMHAFGEKEKAKELGAMGFRASDIKQGIVPESLLRVESHLCETKMGKIFEKMELKDLAHNISNRNTMQIFTRESIKEAIEPFSNELEDIEAIEKEINSPVKTKKEEQPPEKDPIMLDALKIGPILSK